LLVFGAGFVLGALRVPYLVPRLGVRTAELLEMPLMSVVILLSARFVVGRFRLAPSTAARLGTGIGALLLALFAELSLAAALGGQTPAEYVAGRDPVSGSAYLGVLCLFAVMPLVLALVTRPKITCG
jgi:hypothetical protein